MTSNSEVILKEVKQMVEEFLNERGLKLSGEKTVITNIGNGFDFLGWNFRKFKGKLLIQPSTKSKKKITEKLSQTIKYYREAKQELLIMKLNQITKGWAEYYHCVCAKSTYALIDHRLWKMLWKWAKRKHPKKCNKWVKIGTGIGKAGDSGRSVLRGGTASNVCLLPDYLYQNTEEKLCMGMLRQMLERVKKLCEFKKVQIVEGAVCVDHVHLCVNIPPKLSLSEFVGYLKGKNCTHDI